MNASKPSRRDDYLKNNYQETRNTYGSDDIRQKKSASPVQSSKMNEKSKTPQYHHVESIWRVLLDLLTLGILLGAGLVSNFIATPFSRGFFCTDTTIRYPYKTDTVPSYVAVIVSAGTPLVFMWVTEIVKFIYFKRMKESSYEIGFELTPSYRVSIPTVIRNIYILSVTFGYGYLSTFVFTETSKNFLGSLRPHFLSVCIPSLNCSTVTVLHTFHNHLQSGIDFTCLGSDSDIIRNARRSFLSGHTSAMFYGCGFLIMYLHAAWSWRHLGLITHFIQTGLAVGASYVGYSRITDYHHHWQDVLGGGSVGAVVAFTTFRFILNWVHLRGSFLPYHFNMNRTRSGVSHRSNESGKSYW